MEKKRYANIDLLKAIAIVMVISLHSKLFNTDFISSGKISIYIQYSIRLICEGVAIFVFVNGFLLLGKKEFELRKHLLKTLKILGVLIEWSFILTIVVKLIYKEPMQIMPVIKNVFTTEINNKYTGVLWFLQNLIALYLIYPVLKIIYDKDKRIYTYLFIVLLVNTIAINFLGHISTLINAKYKFNAIDIVLSYIGKFQILTNRNFLIFFMLGGLVAENKERFENQKIRKISVIAGFIMWCVSVLYAIVVSKLQNKTYADNFVYESVTMLACLIMFYAITYKYENKNRIIDKLTNVIGKNSLGIYLIHIIIIRVVDQYIAMPQNILFRIAKVIVVLFTSLGITLIIKKIPKVNKLIEL